MAFLRKILFVLLLPFALAAEELLFSVPFETDLLLQKEGFTVGYSKRYRQAVWVAYRLTAETLLAEQVKRKEKFAIDSKVKTAPVRPEDYRHSGYDKGHLAPAADMTYSLASMNDSFLMTNISPQIPGCNRGIWKRVENQVRRWAVKEKTLYVITGPIFSDNPQVMGKSAIPVPDAFYKVVLDLTPPMKMAGFIVSNQTSKRRISSFAVPVDEVERITGYDFFAELDDKIENQLERTCDLRQWE